MKNNPTIIAKIERCEAEIESAADAIQTALVTARLGSATSASAILQFAGNLLKAAQELETINFVDRHG